MMIAGVLVLTHCSGGNKKEEPAPTKPSSSVTEKTEAALPKVETASIDEINSALKKITVDFPHNSDRPTKDLFPKGQLEKVTGMIRAAKIDANGEYIVVVTGHATKVGPEKYNKGLAQRRAQYMVDWFANGGVPRNAMKATNDGTKKNRRAVSFELRKR